MKEEERWRGEGRGLCTAGESWYKCWTVAVGKYNVFINVLCPHLPTVKDINRIVTYEFTVCVFSQLSTGQHKI